MRKVISEPGLYFRRRRRSRNVVTLDKRILTIESSDAERIQTSEKKNLLIDSYVKWRIADRACTRDLRRQRARRPERQAQIHATP